MSTAETPSVAALCASQATRQGRPLSRWGAAAFYLFIAVLALAPYPLGSNRPWSWSLLSLLIALCWLLWSVSVWRESQSVSALTRGFAGPLVLAGLALIWGGVQILPFVPHAWEHPLWRMASGVLGTKMAGTISVAPWHTATELMKLATYAMAAWLARSFCGRTGRAGRLLDSLILIGVLYAVYGFVLVLLGQSQFQLFYGMRAVREARDLSGPFVNHNSFATYSGLIALCAGARLVSGGWQEISWLRGAGRIAVAAVHYVLGRGVLWFVATVLTLSAVIATGSRGGNFATLSALAAMLGAGMMLAAQEAPLKFAVTTGLVVCAGIALLFAMNGAYLISHLDDMAATGLNQNMRFLFWDAALRMVRDAPLLGLGLGTYQTTYPLYSAATVPFVVDKAHNDYLELAAGWGLPAALLWWSALLWLLGICARGIFKRRRNRLYPMVALGAGILVGIHANFDFSLQMPAVALTFAAILGVGLAQALPTRKAHDWSDPELELGP